MRRCAAWVTEWSGKIRRNLPVKIFCFTCLLLLAVCIVTYGLIAWMMPVTYQADRNRVLSEQAESLIQELSKTTLSACGPLLEKFASDYDAQVSILDETGQPVAGTKDLAQTEEEEGRVTISQIQTEEGMTLQTNESIHITQTVATPFSFQGSQDVYQLMVVGRIRGVNQAMEALGKLWPWLLASVVSVSILGSFFYARYVTRLSRAMGALQGANEALRRDMEREREMERQRMEFFAAASHELKTPITIVKGQLGGMLDGVGVYADRERYLARSLQVMGSMERLVGELLTLSRMEGEKVRRGIKPLNLTDLLTACVEEYTDLFAQKEQTLHVSLAPDLQVSGEWNLLSKAVCNLLTNGAMYSPDGAELFLSAREEGEQIYFSLENTGVHLSEERIPHLFEAFYRGEGSRNRQTGGSGLGLYLVKRILEYHCGEIRIRNTAAGVCVEVWLPRTNSTETTTSC